MLVMDEDSADAGLLQMVAALLAGNGIVLLVGDAHKAIADKYLTLWSEAGLPDNLLLVLPLSMAKAVLADLCLKGFIFCSHSNLIKPVQRLLLERKGGLIPLIVDNKPAALLMAMVLEKTLTINTTAVGGNMPLMAMADSTTL